MKSVQWNATYRFKIDFGFAKRRVAVFASTRDEAIDEVKRHAILFRHEDQFSIDHIVRNDGKHH